MIVDANRLGFLLSKPDNEDVQPIRKWLRDKRGMIVYSTGGKFAEEVRGHARRELAELARSKQARFVSRQRWQPEWERLEKYANCKSDDSHVLALAKVSGARLLYTGDQALRNDFKTGKWKNGRFIIHGPRGKLYSSKNNSDLLTADACKMK